MNPLFRTFVRLLPVLVVAVIAYCWTHRPAPSDLFPAESKPTQRWIKLLRSNYAEKRLEAADALAAMEADAEPAAPALVAALGDRDIRVQRQVQVAIRKIGPPAVPPLIAALNHGNKAQRIAAARLLNELEPTNPAGVAALIEGIQTEEWRYEAALALARIGAPSVPPLVQTLNNANPEVRRAVADVLRDIGADSAPAVPVLTNRLRDEEEGVRVAAARALGAIGPAAKDAVPVLLASFSDGDFPLRLQAAETIVQIGPSAVPALIAGLADRDKTRRVWATRAIFQIGPAAKSAVPALRELLADSDPTVRREAARALAALDHDEKVVDILAEAMRDDEYRDWAIGALCQCGKAGRAVLVAALKDPDAEVRGETARALGRLGVAARDTVPALIETLKDPDRTVRREAAHALGWIPADTALSVPALAGVLNDSWSVNRSEAAIALSRFGPKAKDAAPALIGNLADDDVNVSQEAKKALAEIGPAALPALREAAEVAVGIQARAIADAIREIEDHDGK